MNLEVLECGARAADLARVSGRGVSYHLRTHTPMFEEDIELLQHLLEDEQFYVLLELKRAERHALLALEKLTPQTEYLRDELEQHLRQLYVLLQKMEVEEHLRRDREVLVSPPAEVAEQGVGAWISGRPTE